MQELLGIIEKYDSIIIHRHSKPDGDALGAQIGLKHIILANYKNKRVYTVGDDAERYSFMQDSQMDTVNDSLYKDSLAIILDTSSPSLISDERYKNAAYTIRFDHHIFIEKIANTELVDTSFESCCGLITAFALENSLIIPDIAAKSLFTGMVTDSGRFRYDSTTPRTYALASELTKRNFSQTEIYSNLYAEDFEKLRLRSKYILKINFTEKNVGYIFTPYDELKESSLSPFAISRSMVGVMADIKGVDIWVNFTESGNGSDILCEVRSSKYNINTVAVKYGGGGHTKASGATLHSKDEMQSFLADLDEIIIQHK